MRDYKGVDALGAGDLSMTEKLLRAERFIAGQDFASADDLLGDLLRAEPLNLLAGEKRVSLLLRRKLYAEAGKILERLIEMRPDSARFHNDLGVCRLLAGEAESALAPLGRAREMAPQVSSYADNLAHALRMAGRTAEAVSLAERTRAVDRGRGSQKTAQVARSEASPRLEPAIKGLIQWLGRNKWAGRDPGEVRSAVLCGLRDGRLDARRAQALLDSGESPGPLPPPRPNPEAMALALPALAHLDGNRAIQLSRGLLDLATPGMEGLGWGSPFMRDQEVILPPGAPDTEITCQCGQGLLELWRTGADPGLDQALGGVARFLARDLSRIEGRGESFCFSRTSLDAICAHPANLAAAGFLLAWGQASGEGKTVELGKRALEFSLGEWEQSGSLGYWAQNVRPPAAAGQPGQMETNARLALYMGRLTRLLPGHEPLARAHAALLDGLSAQFHERGAPREGEAANTGGAAWALWALAWAGSRREIMVGLADWLMAHRGQPDGWLKEADPQITEPYVITQALVLAALEAVQRCRTNKEPV